MRTYVGRNLGTFIELMIFSANKLIWVCSPKISPKFASRLVDQARKGVDVKVITSNYENQDSVEVIKRAFKPNKIDEVITKADLLRPKLDYVILKGNAALRPKLRMYLIDGKFAIIGSLDLTESDLYENIGYVIILDDSRDVEKIMEDFIALWGLYLTLGDEMVEYTRSFPRGASLI